MMTFGRKWRALIARLDVNVPGGDMPVQRLFTTLRRFLSADEGVTAMEYALLGGLIAVVIVAAVGNVGVGVNALFSFVADEVAKASSVAP